MKKYLFFTYILVVLGLVGCKDTETVIPKPIEKTFPVNPQVVAMNIEIAGKPFNVELQKNGWRGSASRSWIAENGSPKYIGHNASLFGGDGVAKSITFAMSAPFMPIIDPEDTTFKFEKSYNYTTLLNLFKMGKQTFRNYTNNNIGYDLYFSYVDMNDKPSSFGYSTMGNQDGSKLNIVKIEELSHNRIYVTYEIDCNLYATTDKNEKPKKLVGTIQQLYMYIPF